MDKIERDAWTTELILKDFLAWLKKHKKTSHILTLDMSENIRISFPKALFIKITQSMPIVTQNLHRILELVCLKF